MKNPKDKPESQGQNMPVAKNKAEKNPGNVKPVAKKNSGTERPKESNGKEINKPQIPSVGKEQNEYGQPGKEIPDRDHPHTLPVINARNKN